MLVSRRIRLSFFSNRVHGQAYKYVRSSASTIVKRTQSVVQACEGDHEAAHHWLIDMAATDAQEGNATSGTLVAPGTPQWLYANDEDAERLREEAAQGPRRRKSHSAPLQARGGDGGEADVYRSKRREALHLTGQWQKLMKRCDPGYVMRIAGRAACRTAGSCAIIREWQVLQGVKQSGPHAGHHIELSRRSIAATRQGDDSEGRYLMRQAKVAWRQATEAQHAAALRIEAHNNSASRRGEWELDLHGLHAQEVREQQQQCGMADCAASVL